jgi:L-rhamnonate dehydratase
MKIVRVRTRNVRVEPTASWEDTALVMPTSIFGDLAPQEVDGALHAPALFTLVEIEADDGTIGIGTSGAAHGAGKAVIDSHCAPLILGQDPRRHEYLWQLVYRSNVRFGRSGTAIAALSGIDIALWDLHGKAEGKPVFDLLGGRAQERLPCYASRLYALDDLDRLADEARAWKQAGFTRMKQRFGFGPRDGMEGMRRNVELVSTVREAVGDDVELAADAYMGWDVGYALEMAKRLEHFDLSWIEEPLMPHDIGGYVELKRRFPRQRWSCGEHSYTKWDFKELIDRGAVDILQPDTNRVGGLTEMIKICAMAEAAGLPVVPHATDMHNLQLVFSRAAHVCPLVEYFPLTEPDSGNELFWKAFHGQPLAEDGFLRLGDAPGLGIEVNADVVAPLTLGEPTETTLRSIGHC